MYIDQMCDEEIQALNQRINTADSISLEIKSLIEDTYLIRSSLTSAQEYANRKDYTKAYKSLLNSMSKLIDINQQILEKYSSLSDLLKGNHGT